MTDKQFKELRSILLAQLTISVLGHGLNLTATDGTRAEMSAAFTLETAKVLEKYDLTEEHGDE